MRNIRNLTLAAAISAAFATPAIAEEATSVADALKKGDVTLSFRMRGEDVEAGNAERSLVSLKTRLTYTSADYKGFGLGLEMDDNTHISNADTSDETIDPEYTEVNQYFLSYKAAGNSVKYGRNRILLDNQRFVGGVGFRQNEQTYDSLIYQYKSDAFSAFASYVTRVNRIFGEAAGPKGIRDSETALLNAKYTFSPEIALTGYYYGIDDQTGSVFSTDTMGLRATGKAGDFKYEAEYATQSEGGDSTADYSASYLGLGASYSLKPVTLSIGYESLGNDDLKGYFITPYATLHKFQGWSDVFINGGKGNYKGGVDDLFFKVAGKAGPVKLAVVYHTFDTTDSDAAGFDSYGNELGFVVSGAVKGVNLSLKYADFSAEDDATQDDGTPLVDVTKIWLTAAAKF